MAKKSEQKAFYTKLGEAIRARRVTLGFPKLDFAKGLQMTPQQMGRIEEGSRRVDVWTLIQISKSLKMKLSTLISKGTP